MMPRRVYLDHTGASIPSPKQLEAVAASLQNFISRPFANPHSPHPTGQLTGDMIDASRILQHFKTSSEDYSVVFTSNASVSLKLVGESFDFGYSNVNCPPTFQGPIIPAHASLFTGKKSTLLMLQDSHTSVVGMRRAVACEQIVVVRDFDELNVVLNDATASQQNIKCNKISPDEETRSLFVLTAMSNFCGRKYDLSIVNKLREAFSGRWFSCLDAAAWAGCAPLDLSAYPADFVAISFYKMFGYPTGVGVLLVRNQAASFLRVAHRYFGGGTVKFASPFADVVERREDIAHRLEDGTPNFYGISALRHGFDDLRRYGGIDEISTQSVRLAARVVEFLRNATHANNSPIATVYGWHQQIVDKSSDRLFSEELARWQGPVVNFNLLRDDHSYVGYVEVEKMADLFGIELRTGCFCNQGACVFHLGLDQSSVMKTFQLGKVCGDEMDLTEDGQPVGSVRISFGRTSTIEDVESFIAMVTACFVMGQPLVKSAQLFALPAYDDSSPKIARLSHIFVYPIKSCAPIEPQSWPLSVSIGGSLRYDRAWMIVSTRDGTPLTQKRFPALCTIQPQIDESRHKLILKDSFDQIEDLEVDIQPNPIYYKAESIVVVKMCVDSIATLCDIGGYVATKWLTRLNASLGEDCRLVGFSSPTVNPDCSSTRQNFSNQADFLLVTRPSLERLSAVSGLDYDSIVRRFRPNFVLDFYGPDADTVTPFEEDSFEELYIGSARFKRTGEKDPNVLIALRDMRRSGSLSGDQKLTFGVYLKQIVTDQLTSSRNENGPKQIQTEEQTLIPRLTRVSVGCNVRIFRRHESKP